MKHAPDFPYYNGVPVAVCTGGWLVVLAGLCVAFATLTLVPAAGVPALFFRACLFAAIPLMCLAAVTGRHWRALFGPVGPRQIGQMVVTAAAMLLVSFALALLVSRYSAMSQNPLATAWRDLSWGGLVVALLPTLPQLFGEELLAILPFLAILWLAHARLGLARRPSIALAVVCSCIVFGAAHLSTYGWNWMQAFGIIGVSRVALTLGYVWARNIWVPTGAHILNDWAEFAFLHAIMTQR